MTAGRRIGDVMTRAVISVRPDTGYRRILELMQGHRVSAVPVLAVTGHPLGVVSEDDLLAKERALAMLTGAALAERWRIGEDAGRSRGRNAGELMTAPAITVTEDVTLAHAAWRMCSARVRRLLVVDEHGLLVGIVSRGDLLRPYGATGAEIREEVLENLRVRSAWSDLPGVRFTV